MKNTVRVLLVGAVLAVGLPAGASAAPVSDISVQVPDDLPVGTTTALPVMATLRGNVTGFELTATVDGSAATLVGADSRGRAARRAGVRDLSLGDLGDRAVLAGLVDRGRGLTGRVQLGVLHVRPTQPGRIQLRLGAARLVQDRGAAVTSTSTPASVAVLEAGGGGPRVAAPALPWSLPRTSGRAVRVRDRDPELELLWQEARLAEDPCGPAYRRADLTGDRCLDVADLAAQGVPARTGDAPSTQRPTARSTEQADSSMATTSLAAAAVNPPLVVNSTSDEWDRTVGNGDCRTASGVCSLRAALQEANARSGPDTVTFSVPGTGPHTINIAQRLPALTDASGGTTIDGYTQPGATPNTDPVVSNAVVGIQIRGTGGGYDAFVMTSAGNRLRGLSVFNVRRPVWIYGAGAVGNAVVGSIIGTDAAATFVSALGDFAHGINVEQDAPGTIIGSADPADRNVISGNGRHGVGIWHNGSDGTRVQGNIVGLSPDGTRRVPNRKHGLDMNFGASGTLIGGAAPGERNLVSGNDDTGVEVSHTTLTTGNRIVGNYIGTDPTGATGSAVTANANTGVYIEDGSSDNVVEGNVIGNNLKGGVQIVNLGTNGVSTGNVVRNNRIGVGTTGLPVPNAFGVLVNGSGSVIGPDNTIRFNKGPGVRSDEVDAVRNRVTSNVIVDNTGLSIDLSPIGQVNVNDEGDADLGANERLNYPEPFDATADRLRGRTCGGCTVEVFRTGTATGHGPAVELVATATAADDGSFLVPAPRVVPGEALSAVSIDPAGNTSEMSPNIAVAEGNRAPVVDAGDDVSVVEGNSVDLHATTSDVDGDTVVVDWDLDADGTFEAQGPDVVFTAPDVTATTTRVVTARATDPAGLRSTDSLTVTVREAGTPPTGTLTAPATADEGQPFPVAVEDGATTDGSVPRYAFSCTGADLSGTTYAAASTSSRTTCTVDDDVVGAPVSAAVVDATNRATVLRGTVDVRNVAPTARLVTPAEAVAGQAISVEVADLQDSSPADRQALTTSLRCGSAAATSGTAATCTAGPGAQTPVSLVVTDDEGGSTTYSAVVVTHPNLLNNGSFEEGRTADGRPLGWTGVSPASTTPLVSSPVASGSSAVSSPATGRSTSVLTQSYSALQRTRYTLSGKVNVPATGSGSVTLRLRWYDASNTNVATLQIGTVSAPTPGFVPISQSFPARNGAVRAQVEIAWNTTDRAIAVDDLVLSRSNLLLNPGLELDANGDSSPDSWAPNSRFTRSATTARTGQYSGRNQGDGGPFTSAQRTDLLVPGATYHVSAWVYLPSARTDTVVSTIVRWLDPALVSISAPVVARVTGSTPGWVPVSATVTAPSGAAGANFELRFANLTTEAYVDDVVFTLA